MVRPYAKKCNGLFEQKPAREPLKMSAKIARAMQKGGS